MVVPPVIEERVLIHSNDKTSNREIVYDLIHLQYEVATKFNEAQSNGHKDFQISLGAHEFVIARNAVMNQYRRYGWSVEERLGEVENSYTFRKY